MREIALHSSDESMAVRAAWLHFAGGMTQAAVAKRLGVTSTKAHRLIARASQAGLVKFTVDSKIAGCVQLEDDLSALYGLSYCEVAPDLFEDGLPLRALGVAGAGFLRREITSGENDLIGIGHGRTLAAAVGHLPLQDAGKTKFVSLLGGLSRNYAANPHDVMHRLANRTGAAAYFMPVPFFANTVEDREILLSQRGVLDVFELATRSGLKIVGIGTAKPEASLVSGGMIGRAEIADVKAKGGVGEMLGHFFDAAGKSIETALTERTVSVRLKDLDGTRVVALAGGDEKIGAIRSVLLSGRLSGLITDERTAKALVTNETS